MEFFEMVKSVRFVMVSTLRCHTYHVTQYRLKNRDVTLKRYYGALMADGGFDPGCDPCDTD